MNLQEAKELIKQHPGQFYTYIMKRPNGIPFYVGKGGNCRLKGCRIEAHEADSLADRVKEISFLKFGRMMARLIMRLLNLQLMRIGHLILK